MKKLNLLLLLFLNLEASKVDGELRFGGVHIKDDIGDKFSTLSLGGNLGIKTDSIYGISAGARFYTTNAIFGKDSEGMFLDSNNNSYSILGEAYIQADLGKSRLKVGRQIVDTPYIDSDDIGMIPNTFQGVTFSNRDIEDTTFILNALNRWAGVDSDIPEKFNRMQNSDDAVVTAGVIYEGIKNTIVQAWHYNIDNGDFNYFEVGYENKKFNLSAQYTTQGSDNSAFGILTGINIGELALMTAYNKTDGVVSNGFGGGPFFTSSEEHTIADINNQEAISIGGEYFINDIDIAISHVNFSKGENETDYMTSYSLNKKLSFDLIYSDMYNDGKMVRFFTNYNF